MPDFSIHIFRKFLKEQGLTIAQTYGTTEMWHRDDLEQPVYIDNSIEKLPSGLFRKNLEILGITEGEFYQWLSLQN